MPRTSAARGAAIAAAVELFRRQGYAASGLEEILTVSGAPKGSFYHHFAGGKEQLAVEALTFSGERVRERIEQAAAAASSPGMLVSTIAAIQARELHDSGYGLGCPVATVTLELASTSDAIAVAAAAAFDSWAKPLADRLTEAGHTAVEADRLARWAIANLEGALVLARAARDASIVTDAAAVTASVLDNRQSITDHAPARP